MADDNKESVDTLGDIFSGPAAESQPSGDGESKPADTTTDSTDSKKDESSPAPGSEEASPDADHKSSDESDPPSDKTPEELAAEKKPDGDKSKDKKDETPAPAEETKQLQSRLEETRNWGRQLNQQNQDMRKIIESQAQQLQVIQKKLDGTWTDEDEAALHKGESQEDVATRAVVAGKALASRAAALREFTAEHGGDVAKASAALGQALSEYDALFGQNPMMLQIISNDESPVHAMLHMVERHKFETKYGSTPKHWVENITKEARATLEKEIRKQVLADIRTGKQKAADAPETLANTGSGDHGDSGKLKEEKPEPLKSLFG